jgi:orotidine-5'-phosphate decarboxylase
MGVTVLTSEDAAPAVMRERVLERALMARECGLDGIVCSGLEAETVKAACGRDFLCLCPGIRFAGTEGGDDQARVCTPVQAALAGADFIVMGRPITRAGDPAKAAKAALEEARRSI